MTRTQQWLAGAIGLLVVAAAVGIGTLGGGKKSKAPLVSSGPVPSVTTTAPANASAASTTTISRGSSAKTSAWHIPAAGAYRYHYRQTGANPADYDSVLEIAGAGPNSYTERRDQKPSKVVTTFTVGRAGVLQTEFTFDTASGPQTCRWDKPLPILPPSGAPGTEFRGVGNCSFKLGSSPANVHLETAAKVVGVKSAKLGNQTVQLLRVDGQTVVRTTTDKAVITRTTNFTEYFDTVRGLLAESVENATEQGPSGQSSFRIVETMLTVQPEVH